MKVLHLTAHLGGGVGKALSGLATQSSVSGSGVQHLFACLEAPEKDQFVELIRESGSEVIISPKKEELESLIRDSDILHLEWWNHPATIRCLCSLSHLPMRLLAWSHSSGLYNPIIPHKLVRASHKFLFTSKCSFEAEGMANLATELKDRLGVVSSSGGFQELPEVSCNNEEDKPLSVGYFGSLNFVKLHPRYVEHLAAVRVPDFQVRLIGDLTNRDILIQQCEGIGKPEMLIFRGYTTDIGSELGMINVNAYLLNPEHYGTTENALLEAMAMGVVPIVLDNPCERNIVEHGKTGIIVRSPREFADAIEWFSINPSERVRLGKEAAKAVRERFTPRRMERSLNEHYQSVATMEKRAIDFTGIFGTDPADWFLSCQGYKDVFADDGSINAIDGIERNYGLFEENKGTVFHYSECFPDNPKLKLWARNLRLLQ